MTDPESSEFNAFAGTWIPGQARNDGFLQWYYKWQEIKPDPIAFLVLAQIMGEPLQLRAGCCVVSARSSQRRYCGDGGGAPNERCSEDGSRSYPMDSYLPEGFR